MFSGKSEISDTEGKKYIFFPIVKRFNSVHDKREFKTHDSNSNGNVAKQKV